MIILALDSKAPFNIISNHKYNIKHKNKINIK